MFHRSPRGGWSGWGIDTVTVGRTRRARHRGVSGTLRTLAGAALALAVLPAAARSDDGVAGLRAAYVRALDGDEAALNQALALAEQALTQAGPARPLVLSFKGSLLSLKAREATLPWTKLALADDSAALLDQAFAGRQTAVTPDQPLADLEIITVRAATFANFPAFLGRDQDARDALAAAANHPAFARAPAGNRALVLAWQAVYAWRAGALAEARQRLAAAEQADLQRARQIWDQR